MTDTVGGYHCPYGCGYRAVVPVLIRDHQNTCPLKPQETK